MWKLRHTLVALWNGPSSSTVLGVMSWLTDGSLSLSPLRHNGRCSQWLQSTRVPLALKPTGNASVFHQKSTLNAQTRLPWSKTKSSHWIYTIQTKDLYLGWTRITSISLPYNNKPLTSPWLGGLSHREHVVIWSSISILFVKVFLRNPFVTKMTNERVSTCTVGSGVPAPRITWSRIRQCYHDYKS